MENRRLILAILLSVAVWYLWMHFFKPPAPVKKDAVSYNETYETHEKHKELIDEKVKKALSKKAAKKSTLKVIPSKLTKETLVNISTDKYIVSLSNRGGSIKSFKYKEDERDVELVVNRTKFNAKGAFDFSINLNEDEFLRGDLLEDSLWNYQEVSDSVIKFYTNFLISNNPVRLEKIYTFNKDNFYFKIEYNLINNGKREVVIPNGYLIVSPSDFLGPEMDFENTYNQLSHIYNLNGEFEKVEKGGGFFSKGENITTESGDVKWVGVMSRYFLLIMLAENFNGSGVICDLRGNSGYKTGLYVPVDSINPGEKLKKSFKIYVGEKNKDKLAAIDESLKDAADVSAWIEPIRDLLLWCLLKINMVVGNMGWSLVIFSIVSKILMLPLTQKSTESMKKMQALTPKMNELKEKFKDRPDQLNKEMMKLYKTNKVNPMGGCLPMLLQMPFFFALYSALINSVDLWQAPFVFWIQDLSLPDTVLTFQGFNLNILPIIMTITSFLQQKLTPTSGAVGQQQKLMMMMPLIFIFIFWSMPSGLVLYWTLQNGMQVLHQLYTNRKSDDEEKK